MFEAIDDRAGIWNGCAGNATWVTVCPEASSRSMARWKFVR
jgi:hypothetical protein